MAAKQEGGLLAQVTALRQAVASAQTIRAQAEAGVRSAAQRIAEIDARLQELGIDPEHAEDTVRTMEAQLATLLAELEVRVAQERQACQAILTQLS